MRERISGEVNSNSDSGITPTGMMSFFGVDQYLIPEGPSGFPNAHRKPKRGVDPLNKLREARYSRHPNFLEF